MSITWQAQSANQEAPCESERRRAPTRIVSESLPPKGLELLSTIARGMIHKPHVINTGDKIKWQ